ncbi:MAG: PepSY-associated TM helix domain-containing protein [Oceanicaulis sp.]
MKPAYARLIRLLRSIHKWAGLLLLLPLALISVSGTVLIFDQQIIQGRLPELRGEPPASFEEVARDLDQIDRLAGDLGWNLVRLPQPERPYYDIWLMSDERAYFAPGAETFADRFYALERPETFLFELHAHLLSGHSGESIVAWLGVGALALAVGGLLVWWPGRRSLKARHLAPKDARPRTMLRLHSAVMAVTAPAALLLIISGVLTAFPGTAERALGAVFGGPVQSSWPAPRPYPETRDWRAVLQVADTAFPDDDMVMLFKPAPGEDGIIWLRTRREAEWHPNGRSEIYIDPQTVTLLGVKDATAHGAGMRAALGAYPVHAVRGGGAWLTPLGVIGGLALIIGPAAALIAFVRRKRKQPA